MTVVNETTKHKLTKYVFLSYVEFLELICRIALISLNMQDLIEYKVEVLLEIMYT